MRTFCRPISLLLSTVLAAGSIIQAQGVTPAISAEPGELHIAVDRSKSGGNNGLTVSITDQQGNAVPNAAVLFRLPAESPSGIFSDGSRVAVINTDMAGQATIKDIQWSGDSGKALIRVTASKGTAHAGLMVEQELGQPAVETAKSTPKESAPIHAPAQTKPTSMAPPQIAATEAPKPAQPAQPASEDTAAAPVLISSSGTTLRGPRTESIPTVTITNTTGHSNTGASGHSRKWLWIGIGGAAAAGMAVAFIGGKGGSSTSATPGTQTSIGSPSISIGHP